MALGWPRPKGCVKCPLIRPWLRCSSQRLWVSGLRTVVMVSVPLWGCWHMSGDPGACRPHSARPTWAGPSPLGGQAGVQQQ